MFAAMSSRMMRKVGAAEMRDKFHKLLAFKDRVWERTARAVQGQGGCRHDEGLGDNAPVGQISGEDDQ